VIGVLVRRGADFASDEDTVQEALIRADLQWSRCGIFVVRDFWLVAVVFLGRFS
jgi:predicted RNA polymerase sigma factor